MFADIENAEILGPDPEQTYFLDSHPRFDAEGRPVALVVEHASGEPKFAVVGGVATPFEEWRLSSQAPSTGGAKGLVMESGDGTLQFGITVTQ